MKPAVDVDPIETRLLAEQTELIFRLTPFNLAVAAGVSLITAWALAPFTPTNVLLGWLVLLNVNHAARLVLILRYRRVRPAPNQVQPWMNAYLASAFIAGCLWGFLGWALFPPTGNPYQGVVVMILAGMVSGAVFSLSPMFMCFALFALPAVVPPAVFYLMSDEPALRVFGIGVLLYLLAAVAGGRRLAQNYRESLQLRVDLERSLIERETAQQMAEESMHAAERANEAKSRFLATMSHEIRTPMNGILGVTELVLGTELDAPQRHHLETVHKSAENLLAIVNDILDFSRIEAGKIKQERVDFDPRQTIAEITDLLGSRARNKGLEFEYEIAADMPAAVRGDAGRLRQILTNLIGNAVKFTDRGAIRLRAGRGDYPGAASPPPVKVGRAGDAPETQIRLWFSIADTGMGIEPEDRARLFEAFQQGEHANTPRRGGTGLGLTISRQLVELMGGRIGLASEPGRGSTFWFTVRLDPAQGSVKPQGRPAAPVLPPVRGHVLLVEDNRINREVAHTMLRQYGASVTLAENGQQALQRLSELDIDMILMDCEMPVLDGFETTRRIRAREAAAPPPARHIPIVALTANAIEGDRERCLAAGMDDYVAKPFRYAELHGVVARWMPQDARGEGEAELPAAGGR
jgi:signal transduction histidine kinase/ActR/RegA family two-component response regulator